MSPFFSRWFAPHLGSQSAKERDIRSRVDDGCDDWNLVGSLNSDGSHSVVLDLDCPHVYRPSTRPGHAHLLIPTHLTADDHAQLLRLLVKANVISEQSFEHAERREWTTFVRRPGVVKASTDADSDEYLYEDLVERRVAVLDVETDVATVPEDEP